MSDPIVPTVGGDAEAETESWLYRLPDFLDRVRDEGPIALAEAVDDPVAGFMYHHRGVRVPGPDAILDADDDTLELRLDAIGDRTCRVAFDARRSWDVFLVKLPGDEPALAWMTDAEFDAEEADRFDGKEEAIAAGRFSFGLYLERSGAWRMVADRARDSKAPFFILRPTGRTYVPPPGFDLDHDVVPAEVRGGQAPDHLGVVDARIGPTA